MAKQAPKNPDREAHPSVTLRVMTAAAMETLVAVLSKEGYDPMDIARELRHQTYAICPRGK